MHAFVTSVQLMNAADELLPLTAGGRPALPADTPEAQQAEVQAMLLKATARHIAPYALEWEGLKQNRLGSYLQRRKSLAGGSWEAAYRPALQPLGGLLRRVLSADPQNLFLPAQSTAEQFLAARAAAQVVQSAPSTISQQLQQAQHSGQQVLPAEQLEALLHHLAVMGAPDALGCRELQQKAFPQGRRSVAAAVVDSCERLLVLEPHSPQALITAGSGFCHIATSSSNPAQLRPLLRRGMDCLMAAVRAAVAVRSPYWKVVAGSQTLVFAGLSLVTVSTSDMAVLIAAAEEAPAAVKRLKGVLPHSWVASLRADADAATAALPAARLRRQGSSGTAANQMAISMAAAAQQAAQEGCACSGCGQRAIGLRRCARCKHAACEFGWEVLG